MLPPRLVAMFSAANNAWSAAQWAWWIFALAFPTAAAALMAWLATETAGFWGRFGWLGVAVIALLTFFVVSASLALLADFMRWRRGSLPLPLVKKSGEPPKPAPQPDHPFSLERLIPRVTMYSATGPGGPSPKAAAILIYDALRSGKARAWGRESYEFPPVIPHPPPLRKPIDQTFWQRNTIEELDTWANGKSLVKKDWSPITKPDEDCERAKATCYWDIVFDPKEARANWPHKDDWMSA